MVEEESFKEQRIRKMTSLYYSKPEVQKAIYEFAKNREICPRYFEGFGKRPDSFQYPGDVFEMVKKGATSFNCSEEIWSDPMKISSGMTEKQANDLRIGWDLLIDIDCKWFDYSKKTAQALCSVLKKNKLKNFGIKFSGSKGFHIIIPWKSFPKEVGGIETKNLFPELPKKLILFLRAETEKEMKLLLPDDFYEQFKDAKIKKGIKCNKCGEIVSHSKKVSFYCERCKIGEEKILPLFATDKTYACGRCKKPMIEKMSKDFFKCEKCQINSNSNPKNFSRTVQVDLFELMGLDLVMISPRHLFRMPYSLHEKTALASVVLSEDELENFDLKDADPLKIKIRDYYPNAKEGEASELVLQASDWYKENCKEPKSYDEKKSTDFKQIKIENLSDKHFPPCVKNILKGVSDGRKRSLFILINLFRSAGLEIAEIEKIIYEWNAKNEVPLKEGEIKNHLTMSYKKKPIMPPNCKEFYQEIGVCQPDYSCNSVKNPLSYLIKKNLSENYSNKKKSSKK